MSEASWLQGNRAAYQAILNECLLHLGRAETGPVAELARAVSELESVRVALRSVCEEHGDNDWDNDLHLADVVEKHLARHLDADVE